MFKNLLLLSIFIGIIIVSVIIYFKYEVKDQKIDYILDQSIAVLDTQIKERQMDALQLATVLSKDMGLVNALENDDEDLGYKIIDLYFFDSYKKKAFHFPLAFFCLIISALTIFFKNPTPFYYTVLNTAVFGIPILCIIFILASASA